MRRQLVPAVVAMVIATLVLGLGYPLVVTGIAQVAWPDRADGSLVEVDGRPVGSSLLGQAFGDPGHFWPRPSAAGAGGYDASASGATNLGPTNPELATSVAERVAAYRAANGLAAGVPVPVDAVTASGSGLDPDISVANARLQAPRVAAARGLPVEEVLDLVAEHTSGPTFGFLGAEHVRVLPLNLALDSLDAPVARG